MQIFLNLRLKIYFETKQIRDRIIACVSRCRGNLIYICCGTLRQPRYRLEIVFSSSRETRQPRSQNPKINFKLIFISRLQREREAAVIHEAAAVDKGDAPS